MSASPSMDRARSYLDVQITRTAPMPPGIHPHAGGLFITISRECGTGGSAFGQLLADRLNSERKSGEPAWDFFDQNIVEDVLREEHLPPRLARFLPEDRVSEITGSVGEIVGLHPNLWTLVQKTNRLIRSIAQHGHAIFVGRGVNFATASLPEGVHVRLVAPEDERVARLSRALGIPKNEAQTRVRRTDAARAHYVTSAFDRDIADPVSYDLVLNIARLSFAACIEMVVQALPRPSSQTERSRAAAIHF